MTMSDHAEVVARNEWPRIEVPDVGAWTPTDRVSVVIPAKGSQANLERCLVALGHQTYPHELLDITVVDDASEPALAAPAQIAGVPVRLERHAPHGTFGAGRARITGAAVGTGEIVVFLDGDILVAPTFVDEHARWHHAVPYAVVTGVLGFADFDALDPGGLGDVLDGAGLEAFVGDRGHDAQEWRDRHFARSHDLTTDAVDLFRSTIGAVTSLRRDFLDQIGGYRAVGVRGVEDTEFGYRLHNNGGLFVLERSSRLWHQGRRSFDSGKRAQINEVRRPHVEDLMPVPGMRPARAERRHRVPTLAVRITPGSHAAEAATMASIQECPDLDVVVLLSPEQATSHAGAVTGTGAGSPGGHGAGPLVVSEGDLDHIDRLAVPYVLEVRSGATIAPTTPAALVEAMRDGLLGVLHLIGDETTDLAKVIWSRAAARARHAGASRPETERELAGRLFAERWTAASDLGVHATEHVDVRPLHHQSRTRVAASAAPSERVAAVTDLDIVYLTDLRFPGGTSSSLVDEVRAAHAAGYRVGVLHVASEAVGVGTIVNRRVYELIDDGAAVSLLPGEAVRARLAIVKHPRVFSRPLGGRLPITADRVMVTVGQVPGHGDHTEYYGPAEIDANIREALEGVPEWAPVSPVVRRSLAGIEVTDTDWVEVLDGATWVAPRDVPAATGPVIGRHGRPDPLKWPATTADILAAYPDDPAVTVRVLGAPASVPEQLGGAPSNWEILEFGSVDPREYLASIDFFVYHHHPDLVEAFGRTILEALASGAVAIVAPHFEELFGDACLYSDPAGVRSIVDRLSNDPEAYRRQSELGRSIVAERFSHDAHVARIAALVGPPSTGTIVARAPGSFDHIPPGMFSDRPTVLVSCIGATSEMVEVVLRSLDEHRRRHLGFTPVVVVSGARLELADELGIEMKSITSRKRWDDQSTPWPEYARRRLRQLASAYQVDSIVTWDLTHPDAWIALGAWSRPRRLAAPDDHTDD